MASQQQSGQKAIFLRVIEAEDKARALRQAIADPQSPARFEVDPHDFQVIPRAPFAYWASDRMRAIFKVPIVLFEARRGPSTCDDFRYLEQHGNPRCQTCSWLLDSICKGWFFFALLCRYSSLS